MAQPGPWLLSLQTQTARADEALQVARATVQKLLTEELGEAELQQAKQNLVGGFPLLFDSNQEIVQYLALIGFYHLPLDYLARFPERIQALSLAQVKDTLTRRLRPETWVEVQVGKPIAAVQP
jgi:zinc protease